MGVSTEKLVEKHYDIASQWASVFVETQARKILRDHKNLDEFVMCMGSWFFTYKVGAIDHQGIEITKDMSPIIHEGTGPKYIEESRLSKFIADWDAVLRITGEPMRFTATGPVIRDW